MNGHGVLMIFCCYLNLLLSSWTTEDFPCNIEKSIELQGKGTCIRMAVQPHPGRNFLKDGINAN